MPLRSWAPWLLVLAVGCATSDDSRPAPKPKKAAAARYEASGTAQEVVSKVRQHFAGPPKLSAYRVVR